MCARLTRGRKTKCVCEYVCKKKEQCMCRGITSLCNEGIYSVRRVSEWQKERKIEEKG